MTIEARNVAQAFGYTPEQLQSVPSESYMGLSCGNPVAAASIKEVRQGSPLHMCFSVWEDNFRQGETVLDLGSGGGIDILLAAVKVGPLGQAIGIDISAVSIFSIYVLPNRNELEYIRKWYPSRVVMP